ncbi:MerR family transcriptional regulator [Vallitalea okinawensis]|uniref:MerR family transcriptional regulator n=1 Tax=Vallitalea okinawensis TaxID=2078660 RepID=UPI000CFDB4E6|nr:MerR family transcriptional regulator [Vallitalea okinawensis]
MFKIGEFSNFTKVSTRMLRYYDQVGLFKPIKIDNFSGYRYYSASQMTELAKIITLRDAGFNIAEISRLIKMENEQDVLDELKRKQLEIQENINNEKMKMWNIDKIISNFGKEMLIMNYEVILKEIPACKVVSTRSQVKDYSKEIDLWAALGEFAQNNLLQPDGAPFAIYHDDEYKEKNVDIEVAMPVAGLQENKGNFVFREVPSVSCMATVLYKGRYENIDGAFHFLANWIEENGYKPCGKVRQVSIKGEWNEPNPDNYLVEIQMPVQK